MIIRKVWGTSRGQLHLTIPMDNKEGIKEGDYVQIKKVKEVEQ